MERDLWFDTTACDEDGVVEQPIMLFVVDAVDEELRGGQRKQVVSHTFKLEKSSRPGEGLQCEKR